jgi:hypothetical protein
MQRPGTPAVTDLYNSTNMLKLEGYKCPTELLEYNDN